MIKLTEKYLIEDIEAVRRQFSHIPADEFDRIIRIDPTFDEGRDSVGKYGKWLLGLYNKDRANLTNAVKDIISEYDSLKNDRRYNIEKDIMRFKSVQDMQNAIDSVEENELSKSQRSKQDKKDKNYDLVFEGDIYWVFVPRNHAGDMALASYGKSRKATWCTAADSQNGIEMYDFYRGKGGKYYVIINKNDYNDKYQFHFGSKQFANWKNNMNGVKYLKEVLKKDKKLSDFFIDEGYKYLLPRCVLTIKKNEVTHIPPECFYRATLLTKELVENHLTDEERRGVPTEEAQKHGVYFYKENGGGCYWLKTKSDESPEYVYIVWPDGVVEDGYYSDALVTEKSDIGVRPALSMWGASIDMNDHFEFGGYGFTVINPNFAVCDVIIDVCQFNKRCRDGNDYETSYIKSFVDNWFNKALADYKQNYNSKTESYKRIRMKEI